MYAHDDWTLFEQKLGKACGTFGQELREVQILYNLKFALDQSRAANLKLPIVAFVRHLPFVHHFCPLRCTECSIVHPPWLPLP